jgi:hypothetical protein
VTQGLIKNTVPFSKWGLPISIRRKFQIGESLFQKRVCDNSGININTLSRECFNKLCYIYTYIFRFISYLVTDIGRI